MTSKRTTRKASPHDAEGIGIPVRTLRAFVAGLARLCGEIGLVRYDIACIFTPRATNDFATVTAGFKRASGAGVVEDVVPVLMRRPDSGHATDDDDKMKNAGGGYGQGKADAATRRPSRGGTEQRGNRKPGGGTKPGGGATS